MKKIVLIAIAQLLSANLFAATVPVGKYELDAAHSKIGFSISHLVISTVEGRFNNFNGEIQVADKNLMQIQAQLSTDSVDTGIKDRDNHLKSPDFFDSAKFPQISFKSKKVTLNESKLLLIGDLTIHGVTKEVALNGKYLGSVKDQFGNEKIAFQAETKIKRADYGLKWSKMVEAGPVVGDEVEISLKIEANKKK